jgi:heme oxygenase
MTPKTVRENIISIQGHITGVKKEIDIIKNNHLKHLHDDVMEIHKKLDSNVSSINNKLDKYLNAFVSFLVAVILLLLGAIIKHFLS